MPGARRLIVAKFLEHDVRYHAVDGGGGPAGVPSCYPQMHPAPSAHPGNSSGTIPGDPFVEDGTGRRPVFGDRELFRRPLWTDLLLLHEHFDGDTAAGLGASHQTGWTGLVADLILQSPGSRGDLPLTPRRQPADRIG